VYAGGRLVVTVPARSKDNPEAFLKRHAGWVLVSLRRQSGKKQLPGGVKDYKQNRPLAHRLVSERIRHFNTFYKFTVGNVTIRNTRSRWGSCSRKGNLSFSYKLVHLSPELSDYIIVHELCHLSEFNHSAAFWQLVAKTIPRYKELRHSLRSFIH
jgi:hypothetical protein